MISGATPKGRNTALTDGAGRGDAEKKECGRAGGEGGGGGRPETSARIKFKRPVEGARSALEFYYVRFAADHSPALDPTSS